MSKYYLSTPVDKPSEVVQQLDEAVILFNSLKEIHASPRAELTAADQKLWARLGQGLSILSYQSKVQDDVRKFSLITSLALAQEEVARAEVLNDKKKWYQSKKAGQAKLRLAHLEKESLELREKLRAAEEELWAANAKMAAVEKKNNDLTEQVYLAKENIFEVNEELKMAKESASLAVEKLQHELTTQKEDEKEKTEVLRGIVTELTIKCKRAMELGTLVDDELTTLRAQYEQAVEELAQLKAEVPSNNDEEEKKEHELKLLRQTKSEEKQIKHCLPTHSPEVAKDRLSQSGSMAVLSSGPHAGSDKDSSASSHDHHLSPLSSTMSSDISSFEAASPVATIKRQCGQPSGLGSGQLVCDRYQPPVADTRYTSEYRNQSPQEVGARSMPMHQPSLDEILGFSDFEDPEDRCYSAVATVTKGSSVRVVSRFDGDILQPTKALSLAAMYRADSDADREVELYWQQRAGHF